MIPPQACVFDIGNVLVTFDFDLARQKILPLVGPEGESPDDVIHSIKNDYEGGGISDETFLQQTHQRTHFQAPVEVLKAAWNEIFHPNLPMWDIVRFLKKNAVPIYLCSNTNGLHKEHLFTHFEIFEEFDGGVFSHEEKSMKPETTIFTNLISKHDLEPSSCLYIDDLEPNILSAQRVGFQSFLYQPKAHSDFIEWFQSYFQTYTPSA